MINNLINNAPEAAFPPIGTRVRLALEILSDEEKHSTEEMDIRLNGYTRGVLNGKSGLIADRYLNWKIVRIRKNSIIVAYQLDPRHFESPEADAEARKEERANYKTRSLNHSRRECARRQQAEEEAAEATAVLQKGKCKNMK